MSETDAEREYLDARAAYDAAMARLREAKRQKPETSADRYRRRKREEREAARAHYLANKERIDAEYEAGMRGLRAQALAILHQKLNLIGSLNAAFDTKEDTP